MSHLGLVSGMIDELKIVELIDELIPQDLDQRKISVGTAIKALIVNGLGFTQRRLYLMPQFFSDKPVELLFGKGISAEHINDSSIGRALDSIYNCGTTELFSAIASQTCKLLGLNIEFFHMDSTSLHVDGEYNSQNPPSNEHIIHITQGYSRDHHPELNQVVLNMIVENSAGIPVHMEALSGNSSDKTTFRKTVEQHVEQLQNTIGFDYLIADSALYSKENIGSISKETKWITRVPETISEAKSTIEKIKESEMETIDDKYKYAAITSEYAEIEQRWLVVYSKDAYKREIKTLDKNFLKNGKKEIASFNKFCKQEFECISDAQKAFDKFVKTCKYIEILQKDMIEIPKYAGKGRPKKKEKPVKTVYSIQGSVYSNINTYENQKVKKGKFIIATNELDSAKLPDLKLFKAYKNQGKVERGFRFIKDPHFMASTVFIKKPERVEAILMIMTLSLMVYAALEMRLRNKLEESKQQIPDQKGKLINKPTMRWVFALFTGIHLLDVKTDKQLICLNLKEFHKKILELMGRNYQKYYLIDV